MEEKIFPSPAVAELMQKLVVESRHHTDSQNTLTDEQFAANKRIQAEVAKSIANPAFVVVDPKSGKEVGRHDLGQVWTEWQNEWVAFLQRVQRETGRQ
jgi:hypothetical protein